MNNNRSTGLPAGRQGGFIETIVLIVIVLLVMRYFDITFTDIYYWIKGLLYDVL